MSDIIDTPPDITKLTVDIMRAMVLDPPQDRASAEAWLKLQVARGSYEMFSERVEVSPALALLLVEKYNTRNRNLVNSHVAAICRKMINGEWEYHSQGISLDVNGMISNGQHRLWAVVTTGMTLPFYVTFGEKETAFAVQDDGRRRSAGDALTTASKEIKYANNYAASLKLLNSLVESEHYIPLGKMVSNKLSLKLMELYPSMKDCMVQGNRIYAAHKCGFTGAAVAYFLISENSLFVDQLPEFWRKLEDGIGCEAKTDPIMRLRKLFSDFRAMRANWQTNKVIVATIITAWNAHVQNKTPGSVRWNNKEQEFPVPL